MDYFGKVLRYIEVKNEIGSFEQYVCNEFANFSNIPNNKYEAFVASCNKEEMKMAIVQELMAKLELYSEFGLCLYNYSPQKFFTKVFNDPLQIEYDFGGKKHYVTAAGLVSINYKFGFFLKSGREYFSFPRDIEETRHNPQLMVYKSFYNLDPVKTDEYFATKTTDNVYILFEELCEIFEISTKRDRSLNLLGVSKNTNKDFEMMKKSIDALVNTSVNSKLTKSAVVDLYQRCVDFSRGNKKYMKYLRENEFLFGIK